MATPVRFQVSGLFEQYDHDFDFPETDEFAIIYGPNGVGKTKTFELIRALSQASVSELQAISFRSAAITYSNHSVLSVQRRSSPTGELLEFDLFRPDIPNVHWTVEVSEEFQAGVIFAGASEWRRISPRVWMDPSDGETLEENELRSRYGSAISSPELDTPDELTKFCAQNQTYLIETQRLLTPRSDRYATFGRSRRRATQGTTTVSRYATELSERLADALATNSKTTANLDRTFPERLLADSRDTTVSENAIRERYSTQNQKRSRLARLSLIGPEPDFPLPARDLKSWERIVLWTYLEDTERKLQTFDQILAQVELLEDILNRRFLRKSVTVSVDDGLAIYTEDNTRIKPEDLSSGEQHELILFYDLLFRATPGAFIMIDEPEISLHIAWQRHFLDDMMRVSKTSKVRIMVATHSPQIIGKWRSRTIRIGPVEEMQAAEGQL